MSKFEYHENTNKHTITSSNVLCCAETGRVVAVFYRESDLQAATGLIKKVELIDGKAYQFSAPSKTIRIGIYIEDKKDFITADEMYINPNACTNIQLLEVKS